MSYSSEVLADKPLAYYRLGEASGTTAVDSSGNGRNGSHTNSGGSAATLAQPGLLVGDTDMAVLNPRVHVPLGSWMDPATLTLEALIRTTRLGVIQQVMDRDSEGGREFQWRIDSTNRMQLIYWTASEGPMFADGTTTLAANTTYHVAASWDGRTVNLYLNGALDGTHTESGPGPLRVGTTNELRIGDHQSDQLFQGVIDEAAFYGAVLSPARVAAHYTAATTTPPPPPPPTTGTMAAALPTFGASLAGLSGAVAGTLGAALPPLRATLAGGTIAPPVTGALVGALPAVWAVLGDSGAGGRLSAVTADLAGAVQVVTHTDTTYANDSYTYGGTALVDYDTPVAPPPPGLVRRDVRRVHQSLPTPDLVRGRPQ